LIGALRLIRCTIGHLINHEARINHGKVETIALVSEFCLHVGSE